jgi:formate/nitrite transporter FocA (FNT family)
VAPAVLGNAIGGVLLVALLNYGQVASDREGAPAGQASP